MILARFQLGVVIAAIVALAAGLAWNVRENSSLRSAAARQTTAAAARTTELQKQVAAEQQRVATAESKVAALLQSVKAAEAARAAASAVSAPVDTQEFLKAALARGTALTRDGKYAEALEEYVKAYRELEAKRPGSAECQSLMGAMAKLGKTYPPALDALGELRDAAMKQHSAQPDLRELVFEIALLNQRLGDGARTIALHDSLPPSDSSSRQSLAMIAFDAFVEAHRYPEALVGKPLGRMLAMIESADRLLANPSQPYAGEMRKSVIDGSVVNIEVLTGAGHADDARMLTEKLLAFDGSDSTRAALREHIERASPPPAR